jgi:hypothetical protein
VTVVNAMMRLAEVTRLRRDDGIAWIRAVRLRTSFVAGLMWRRLRLTGLTFGAAL